MVGIDRFIWKPRTDQRHRNCVASIVVSIWENACDREVLARELNQNYGKTEESLEEGGLINAPATH